MSEGRVRFLFVEDSETDAELEERQLRQGGLIFESRRVEGRDDLEKTLREWTPDLVISDYSLPQFVGIDVLAIVRRHLPDVPFIFVSGTIGEERAIEAMKRGATDYVVKDRLGGLVIRVRRALEEAEQRDKRRALEEQLRHSQKMESLGQLAGAVAHDFNNLLTAILSFGELALRKLKPGDAVREDVEGMYRAGESAVSLTRQLLSFSRKEDTVLRPVEINAVVSAMARLLSRLMGGDVEVKLKLDPSARAVRADVGGLEQILLNLGVNARDAMKKGGTLTLETVGGADQTVVLNVTDSGSGIDPQTLPRIFEPFFTTKEPGKGTGLGLSTVYGLVQAFGGTVSVASELGRGTTFSICLQEASGPSGAESEPAAARPGPSGGHETILVAEDSTPVRTLIVQVLRARGYKVLEAVDGASALNAAREHPGPIDLLVTDVVMPGLDGFELAAQLQAARPGVRVLVMTGLTDESRLEGCAALAKPFTPIGLSRRVRQVLDE